MIILSSVEIIFAATNGYKLQLTRYHGGKTTTPGDNVSSIEMFSSAISQLSIYLTIVRVFSEFKTVNIVTVIVTNVCPIVSHTHLSSAASCWQCAAYATVIPFWQRSVSIAEM